MHRSLISAAVLALAGLTAYPALAAPRTPAAALAPTQLPRDVRPVHYDVFLTPDAAGSRFYGSVSIKLDVLKATDRITLNATDIAFQAARLIPSKGAPMDADFAVDAANQTATFRFPKRLAKGSYQLNISYEGAIGTQAVGLFALDYDTPEGRKRALYTQFENSDARRVIPSWDEPAHKATFALTVDVPATQMAVSNMPVRATVALDEGYKRVAFDTSPRMSTYLLFFSLGEFERATAVEDGTELGVVTKKGALPQAAFALDASKVLLREFNDYFGVRYPLPKLDNVAAPGRSQFFGAMENWGAIFTFEYAMLLDPTISTPADKQTAFKIVAHEMAHQWFGDLVTMRWWDDLWLNEGFASWMESRATARLHPEWNTALEAVDVREKAMARDSVASTHPVVQRIDTVEQASQAFDEVTYQKGESVIRMLENYVGEDAWRQGVRAYMKSHAYGNTVSNQLWEKIEQAARQPVRAIAHDFTLQPGVPMIKVLDASCRDGTTTVKLEQAEFSRDRPQKKPLRWRVPVVAQLAGTSGQARTVVSGGKGSVALAGCGPTVVNAGQAGYYRTLYAPASFAPLAASFDKLAPIDQLGLMSDSWALGVAGLQPMSDILDLAKATPRQADPQVWAKVAAVFASVDAMYEADPVRRARFAAFASARLRPVMDQLGWQPRAGELDAVANLREDLIGTLSELRDPALVAEARRRYAAQGSDPAAIPASLRKAILRVVARHADAATWDALRASAAAEKSPMIKNQYYDLLANAADPALARRALELALTDEPGATNSAAIIGAVAHHHPDMAFDFALAHIAQVNERVDATSRSRYFPRLASSSANPAMIDKLNAYAAAHLAEGSRRDVETAVATIRYRIKVRAERLPAVGAWLDRHGH